MKTRFHYFRIALALIFVLLAGAVPPGLKCRAGCGPDDDYCDSKCCLGTTVVQDITGCGVAPYCDPSYGSIYPVSCPSPGCQYQHQDHKCSLVGGSCRLVPDTRVTGCCKAGDPPSPTDPPGPTDTPVPPCNSTPTAPVLLSPADGSTIYATSVGLTWQGGAIGTCPGAAYDVIDIWNSGWVLVQEAAIPSGGSSYAWGGPYGTYHWEITTYGPSGPVAYSPIWTFTLAGLCPAIVSASPNRATAGDTVNFNITFSHPGGAAQLSRAYFGFTNVCACDPGEAYCSNFERQLARSLAVFSAGISGGVGTIGTDGACSGNSGAGCPWTDFPASSLPLQNAGGSASVNGVSYVDNGNQRTYTWNVTLGTNFPPGVYNYYAMASDLSGHWQDCGGAQWDKLSTVQILSPLAASLTPRHSSLVLNAHDLNLPAQTLDATIGGGVPPYTAILYVSRPDGRVRASLPITVSSFSYGPNEAGDANFGTTMEGTWRAWLTVTDSASHTATSPTAIWDVAFYPVHETP